ncbi:transposase [Pusillimonas sp. DMV24BSW_D]|nr:transposase [Pusillimonas sp. DMV24BSW_D]QIM50233.1 transposase [Pusillimonas sp. DMV24BSW_D]
MKKTRYNDKQIVRILHETDEDTAREVAKRHGVSDDLCLEQDIGQSRNG